MRDAVVDSRFEELARTGDRRIRNELVSENQGLAFALARRYRDRGVPSEDLDQIALEALIRAVDRFDWNRGLRFSTYASRVIEGAVKQYFRDRTWGVHVPRPARERALRVQTAAAELAQSLGRSPTPLDVADHLGITVDEVVFGLEASLAYRTETLDGSLPLAEPQAESDLERAEARLIAPRLVSTLSDFERQVIELRFARSLTQSAIAAELGISQMQVSRTLRRALETLRAHID